MRSQSDRLLAGNAAARSQARATKKGKENGNKIMEKYNYLESMKNDIIDYIRENYTDEEIRSELGERIDWEEKLNDDLWMEDSVTGNASGSYTFSTYKAEEYICHNLDLLSEAMDEFGDDRNALKHGAEWCDIIIRCYLLGQAISNALDSLEKEFSK